MGGMMVLNIDDHGISHHMMVDSFDTPDNWDVTPNLGIYIDNLITYDTARPSKS